MLATAIYPHLTAMNFILSQRLRREMKFLIENGLKFDVWNIDFKQQNDLKMVFKFSFYFVRDFLMLVEKREIF